MKLAHIYDCNCQNWAERFIGPTTRSLLSNYLKFSSVSEFAQPTSKRDNFGELKPLWLNSLNEINENDLLLIGGGGSFNFIRHSFAPRLDKIQIPYMAYAVGWNKLGFGKVKFEDLSPEELDSIIQVSSKAKFFSVRKDATREYIGKWDITFKESPDPACWVSKFHTNLAKPKTFDNYVVISIGGDFQRGRFEINSTNETYVGNHMKEIILGLLASGKSVVITQHRPEDAFITKYISDFSNRNIFVVPWMDLMQDWNYGFSIYKHADFVIASRCHALYLAFSFDRPFIGISDYGKIDGFCKKCRLGNYVYVTEDINKEVKELINNITISDFQNHIAEIKKRWWDETQEQLEELK